MKKLLKQHKHKIIAGHVIAIVSMFSVNAITSLEQATLFFVPYETTSLEPGQTKMLDLNINAKRPINSMAATITYPPDTLEVISFSKEKSFMNLWTEELAIDHSSGTLRFSGGTTMRGGLVGTSTVLTLTVRAKTPGKAILSAGRIEVRAHDSLGSRVPADLRPSTIVINAPPPRVVGTRGEDSAGTVNVPTLPEPPPANPDITGDGRVTLVDLSILVIKIAGKYDARYDLDRNGQLGLSDLSRLFAGIMGIDK